MHEDVGEPVTKSKRCLLNSEADTAASTSKPTTAPAILCDGAEAAAPETAGNDVSFRPFYSWLLSYLASQCKLEARGDLDLPIEMPTIWYEKNLIYTTKTVRSL